tara:strand:+ start:587 stop:760 length:174 start_codon:yes stop_codon:yes gene_type:complete
MGCNKCINGVIMKQISLAEFVPEPCDCVVEDWFKSLRKSYSQDEAGEKQNDELEKDQ